MQDQSASNLTALIESSEDPIWSVDLDYRLVTFNQAFADQCERNLGVRLSIGMRPQDFPSFAMPEQWPPLFTRAIVEGSFRIEFTTFDGLDLDLRFNRILVDGQIIGVSVFGKDISERKKAERALREAESRYRNIFDGAMEGMFQASLDGRSVTVNRALAGMLGYASEEEMALCIANLSHEVWSDIRERARFIKMLKEHGAIRGFECQLKHRDGSKLWVSISSRILPGADGEPNGHEGFIEDITERKLAEKRLRDSEERYRSTFEQAAIGIVHASFEGRFLRYNARFAEILGYPFAELNDRSLFDVTPPEYLAISSEVLHNLVADSAARPRWEKPYIRKDGSLTWVSLTSSIQRDGEGRPLHIVTLVEDINARKAAEDSLAKAQEALRSSEERYHTVFETSLDAIAINRLKDGTYIDANRKFLDTLGFKLNEVIGRNSLDLNIWADPHDRDAVLETLNRHTTCRNTEVQFRKRDGELIWGLVSASVIEIEGELCILSITRDISDAKEAAERIRDLAFYDPLTHLPNRRLLLDRLHMILASSARDTHQRALLFVDLDNFKLLNDTLGHQTGDLLLQEVAERLSACIRKSDTVARLGGDEFVVILDKLSESAEEAAAQAKAVGEKILVAIGKPFQLEGREYRGAASIGITVFGGQPGGTSDVLQQADIAMYQAKSAGRNTVRFFAPALQAAVNSRAALEKDLREGIKAKQFELYYQPQVDDSKLIGAEALMRWNHPDRGLLAPGEFIPIAEETGLILKLGNWAIETACAQVSAWGQSPQTAHIALAVNISVRQFRQPDFVKQVLAALARTGANPRNLKLELTESLLVDNFDDIVTKMTELKAHGLQFSLDDFGTGYSSLTYLKRLPLDELKIDRSFVRDILVDATSGAIAQTIVSLGRAMGLSVVAEGVETEDQKARLLELGCHAFQGFLFSRPLKLTEFEQMWVGDTINSPTRTN